MPPTPPSGSSSARPDRQGGAVPVGGPVVAVVAGVPVGAFVLPGPVFGGAVVGGPENRVAVGVVGGVVGAVDEGVADGVADVLRARSSVPAAPETPADSAGSAGRTVR